MWRETDSFLPCQIPPFGIRPEKMDVKIKSIHFLYLYTNYNVFLKKIQGCVLTFLKRSVIVTVEIICIQIKKMYTNST